MFITTLVVRARNAIAQGAKATANFTKALANLAKKAGPLLGPLLNIVAQVLSWGVKGLSWLPFIGILSGGVITAKHIYDHKSRPVVEDRRSDRVADASSYNTSCSEDAATD